MSIDAILFDLDGTLVQHGHVLLPAKLAEWGYPRSYAEVESTFAQQIQWFYDYTGQLMAAGREDPHLFRRLYERVTMQLEIDDPAIPIYMDAYFSKNPVPPLFDDVLPVLEALIDAGLPLGVITQRDRAGAERFLGEHALSHCFPVVIAGDDGHGRKPSPGPFRAALERLDARPERVYYIGDRIDDDCCGANGAGLRPFLIDRSGQHTAHRSGPAFVHLRSLTDLLTHLPQQEL